MMEQQKKEENNVKQDGGFGYGVKGMMDGCSGVGWRK